MWWQSLWKCLHSFTKNNNNTTNSNTCFYSPFWKAGWKNEIVFSLEYLQNDGILEVFLFKWQNLRYIMLAFVHVSYVCPKYDRKTWDQSNFPPDHENQVHRLVRAEKFPPYCEPSLPSRWDFACLPKTARFWAVPFWLVFWLNLVRAIIFFWGGGKNLVRICSHICSNKRHFIRWIRRINWIFFVRRMEIN